MLVLSRKRTESIHIRDDVVVTVLEIRGNRVRLGIEAPKSVPVHRSEVYEALSCLPPGSSPFPAVLSFEPPAQPIETVELPESDVAPPQKSCPKCGVVQHVRATLCGCGYAFAIRAGPQQDESQ